MSYQQILTQVHDRVGIITLNRPDKLNAMTRTMHREIHQQVRSWNGDDSIGAIVMTGAGRGFCSGADIAGFEAAARGEQRTEATLPTSREWVELIKESKPVVCAINGVAVGVGLTMTLPCDVRVASDEAQLSFRFVRIGLTPEFGSTHYLAHLVGLGRALELMLTGRFVEAAEAERIGLVNRVYPADRLMDEAVALARDIAENPAWHLRQIKRLVHQNYLDADTGSVLADEEQIFAQAMATSEHREALVAFREKRQPRFH